MYVVHVRCFKHAENNVHVRRAGYNEHVRRTCTAYMYHSVNTVLVTHQCTVRVGVVCQVMAEGIYAFYAAHMPNTLNTIKSYSSTFRMPFVTSGMAVNSSRQEVAYELYVRPQYARALRDIIVQYGWNEIWYIYSSNEGLLTPHDSHVSSLPRVKTQKLLTFPRR